MAIHQLVPPAANREINQPPQATCVRGVLLATCRTCIPRSSSVLSAPCVGVWHSASLALPSSHAGLVPPSNAVCSADQWPSCVPCTSPPALPAYCGPGVVSAGGWSLCTVLRPGEREPVHCASAGRCLQRNVRQRAEHHPQRSVRQRQGGGAVPECGRQVCSRFEQRARGWGGGGSTLPTRPPSPPETLDQIFFWAFGRSIFFSGAFGASQCRPKIFFGTFSASKTSAPLWWGGGGSEAKNKFAHLKSAFHFGPFYENSFFS